MPDIEEEIVIRALLENSSTISSSESSSSSSDSYPILRKRVRIRRTLSRITSYAEDTVEKYSDEEFKLHFRMSRQTAYRVIDMLKHSKYLPIHSHGREKILAKKAFLITLWYLSNEESFRQVSDRFNVTYSSAHRCLTRVLDFLISIKSQLIKWPTGNNVKSINDGFKNRKGINNIIGVVDGSHIEINKPKENQDAYINRKGYHSLLLQGIVDHEKKFTDVFCGEPGSMHDARLLRKSGIYKKINNEPNFMGNCFLLGDTAYPNLSWLVTPFKDNPRMTQNQKNFNYKISATRVIVENAFGLLKGRFRRLKKLENFDLKLCSKIMMGCCILHNICIDGNDFLDTDGNDFNQPDAIVINETTGGTNRRQLVFNEMFTTV